jgi:hypothetical protein
VQAVHGTLGRVPGPWRPPQLTALSHAGPRWRLLLGLMFAVGIVAMAVAGSNSDAPRGAAVADASAQSR